MRFPRRIEGFVVYNEKGGLYEPGRSFSLARKREIADAYFNLVEALFPEAPTITEVAKAAEVSWNSARKIMDEVAEHGRVVDPEFLRAEAIRMRKYCPRVLDLEQELFLLSMRAMDPYFTNAEYAKMLEEIYGVTVTPQFITHWFHNRWAFKSTFRVATFTPLDKFMKFNWKRWAAFAVVVNKIQDHLRLNWLDEKHFLNSDSYFKRARTCPLTGRVDAIRVDGNFREAYNCFACVSADPRKSQAMVYSVAKEKGNSKAFLDFIEYLIASRWLRHDDILIMDNASIHTQGEADIVEDLLWDYVRDGHPLHILVLYLPTRSPELNPIELCFHIVSKRVRKYRRQRERGRYVTSPAIEYACTVMNWMDANLIARCAKHCGYKT